MRHHHPWRGLRALPGWNVIYRDLPDDMFGYTHGPSKTIVIERTLNQAERRCTIAHEFEHIAAGHHGCQPQRIEQDIVRRCVQRLLPIGFVVDGLIWSRESQSLWEFADHCWVDLDTAENRLNNLTTAEAREVNRLLSALEPMLR